PQRYTAIATASPHAVVIIILSGVSFSRTSPATTPSPSRISSAVPRNSPVSAAGSGGIAVALDSFAMDPPAGSPIPNASHARGTHPARSDTLRQRPGAGPRIKPAPSLVLDVLTDPALR